MTDDKETPSCETSMLRLRPDTEVYRISADKIQVGLVNHTVTFTNPTVVSTMTALLDRLADGAEHDSLVAAVVEVTGKSTAFVAYLLNTLLSHGCIYSSTTEDSADPEDDLNTFFATAGLDPVSTRRILASKRILGVVPTKAIEQARQIFTSAGLEGCILIPAEPGEPCEAVLERLKQAVDEIRPAQLLAWGFAYKSTLFRLLNEFAVERELSILYGAVEGIVGRLGPLMISRDTACLECVVARMLSNAGQDETSMVSEYRVRYSEKVPPVPPAHPLLVESVLCMLAIELTQITLNRFSQSLGSVVEFIYGKSDSRRHTALRAPRCPVCYPARPHRLAWDAHFPAPLVKSVDA